MELKTYDFPPCTPKPDWDTIKEMAAQANYAVDLKQANRAMSEALRESNARVDLLEAFIIDTRGTLDDANKWAKRAVAKISDMLPKVLEHAVSIRRGTGSAANYENQFRHAEYRAKLVKENLRDARYQMRQMILAVSSVADRTANTVNPEDIAWLREELDQLSGYQEVMATVEGDPFLDGKMPAMNLMEGTGKAAGHKPVTPGDG